MTYHSILRTKQRTGLPEGASVKFISNAKEKGKKADKFPKKERKYMMQKEDNEKYALFYAGCIFIMSYKDVCITMYKAPEWFGKKAYYDKKTVVRNPKKYSRCRTFE